MPRDDRNYSKNTPTYMDHDVKPFDRKTGMNTLKTLMGGNDRLFGPRPAAQVKSNVDEDAWKAKRISEVVRPGNYATGEIYPTRIDTQSPGDED